MVVLIGYWWLSWGNALALVVTVIVRVTDVIFVRVLQMCVVCVMHILFKVVVIGVVGGGVMVVLVLVAMVGNRRTPSTSFNITSTTNIRNATTKYTIN